MIKRPEILSPAGDPEKLRAALLYGADAVYLAGKSFGMRAASDNFSVEELRSAAEYTHSLKSLAPNRRSWLALPLSRARVFPYGHTHCATLRKFYLM